ncbi:MAG: peptidylprolyl isomerase, partial [Firmicutes bacterium]|nr:peptidylprolyl isomerase [Bacillota bacterium]
MAKIVRIEMEDGGVMRAELYPEIAPITVANFEKLVRDGFYDGVIFHRVIPGFMIQGGDP